MRPDLVMGPEERRERFGRNFESNPDEVVEIDNSSDSSSQDTFEFPDIDDLEDFSVHESAVDPETGLLTDESARTIILSDENGPEDVAAPDNDSNAEQGLTQSSESRNYLHKKFRPQLVAVTGDTVSVENVVVNQLEEQNTNMEVMLRRSRAPQNR